MKSVSRYNIASFLVIGLLPALLSTNGFAQPKTAEKNDVTAPLHLLQPDYPVPYKAMPQQEIKKYLEKLEGGES